MANRCDAEIHYNASDHKKVAEILGFDPEDCNPVSWDYRISDSEPTMVHQVEDAEWGLAPYGQHFKDAGVAYIINSYDASVLELGIGARNCTFWFPGMSRSLSLMIDPGRRYLGVNILCPQDCLHNRSSILALVRATIRLSSYEETAAAVIDSLEGKFDPVADPT